MGLVKNTTSSKIGGGQAIYKYAMIDILHYIYIYYVYTYVYIYMFL